MRWLRCNHRSLPKPGLGLSHRLKHMEFWNVCICKRQSRSLRCCKNVLTRLNVSSDHPHRITATARQQQTRLICMRDKVSGSKLFRGGDVAAKRSSLPYLHQSIPCDSNLSQLEHCLG